MQYATKTYSTLSRILLSKSRRVYQITVQWLNITKVNTHLATENTNDTLIRLPKQFIWENDSSKKFKTALQTRDIQRMIHDFLVDSRPDKHINSSLDAVERILFTTANIV